MKSSVRIAQSIVGTSSGRPEDDFYPTPSSITESLLSVENFDGLIWECACGDGAISKVLNERGYKVFSSDLYDHGYGKIGIDFLACNNLVIPNIITNPPFKLAEDFVSHAIFDLKVDKLALLCKLTFLEGKNRSVLLEKSRLSRVHVFRKRVQMTRNGEPSRNSGMIAFAWFVWDKLWNGNPMIGWI